MRTIQEALAERGITAEEAASQVKSQQLNSHNITSTTVDGNDADTKTDTKTDTNTNTNIDTNTDIVTRVMQHKPEMTNIESDSQPVDDNTDTTTKFNVNDIENIKDPVAKKYAEEAYKSFEKGYQKKFQELAQERKLLEQKLSASESWTPEKVQSLLSNQDFIQASQQILQSQNPTDGEMSDQEWSALSDKEKNEFKSMQRELKEMKQYNQRIQMEQQLNQQVTELQQKYASFDKDKVLGLLNDINAGKFSATLEHIHKVSDYEDAIRRAYKMGREDRKLEITEKSEISMPVDGIRIQPNTETTIQRQENESSKQFLMRRLKERMQEKQNKK